MSSRSPAGRRFAPYAARDAVLDARRSSSACLPDSMGVQVGRFGTLPELNWRYPIRRRVGGNVCVLPWKVLLCAVVYFVVLTRSVGAPDDSVSVFSCAVVPIFVFAPKSDVFIVFQCWGTGGMPCRF